MNFSAGHARADEIDRVKALEMKLRSDAISEEEVLELALLNIEPLHNGFRAVELLEGLVKSNPGNVLGRLWLAFCDIYELMDPASLRNARLLCDGILRETSEPRTRAAALLLSATAARQLSNDVDVRNELEECVSLAPNWITSRQVLAREYERHGMKTAAKDQLLKALENAEESPKAGNPLADLFDLLITGRNTYKVTDRIREQLREL